MELIRYNLSAETKIDDIIANYVSDQRSFIGLKVQNGPYRSLFKYLQFFCYSAVFDMIGLGTLYFCLFRRGSRHVITEAGIDLTHKRGAVDAVVVSRPAVLRAQVPEKEPCDVFVGIRENTRIFYHLAPLIANVLSYPK